MLWSSSSGRSILIADFSTLAGHAPACSCVESSLQNACLADECVVKNWKSESVFVYVPHVSGHKISVKGALGVGGGGKEWLKTYASVRTRDGIVL